MVFDEVNYTGLHNIKECTNYTLSTFPQFQGASNSLILHILYRQSSLREKHSHLLLLHRSIEVRTQESK